MRSSHKGYAGALLGTAVVGTALVLMAGMNATVIAGERDGRQTGNAAPVRPAAPATMTPAEMREQRRIAVYNVMYTGLRAKHRADGKLRFPRSLDDIGDDVFFSRTLAKDDVVYYGPLEIKDRTRSERILMHDRRPSEDTGRRVILFADGRVEVSEPAVLAMEP